MFALISSRSGSQSAMLLRWVLQGHHGPLIFFYREWGLISCDSSASWQCTCTIKSCLSVSSLSFLFLFLPCPSLSSLLLSLLSLFSLSLGDDTKWPTRVDVSLNPNTINQFNDKLKVTWSTCFPTIVLHGRQLLWLPVPMTSCSCPVNKIYSEKGSTLKEKNLPLGANSFLLE